MNPIPCARIDSVGALPVADKFGRFLDKQDLSILIGTCFTNLEELPPFSLVRTVRRILARKVIITPD